MYFISSGEVQVGYRNGLIDIDNQTLVNFTYTFVEKSFIGDYYCLFDLSS